MGFEVLLTQFFGFKSFRKYSFPQHLKAASHDSGSEETDASQAGGAEAARAGHCIERGEEGLRRGDEGQSGGAALARARARGAGCPAHLFQARRERSAQGLRQREALVPVPELGELQKCRYHLSRR